MAINPANLQGLTDAEITKLDAKAKTPQEFDTLKAELLKTKAAQAPTPPKATSEPATKLYLTGSLAVSAFSTWVSTHPGQTADQLLKGFTDAFVISDADKSALKELLTPKKPTPTPEPTPAPEPTTKPTTPTVAPGLIIPRTPYPKWWKDSLNARIALTGPGSQVLATVGGTLRLYVATIVITVTGATQITIGFGTAGQSGPIFLGAEGQPMGFVAAMGNSPAPCGSGPLSITATGDPLAPIDIGGWATCFIEQQT